eukprot:5796075-Ditylum_brightwellii.AAC.1
MASMVMDTKPDPLGLSRWVSMKLSVAAEVTTRLVISYMPSNSNNNRLNAIKAQHQRHLWYKLKDFRCPHRAWCEDLIAQLNRWRDDGERILLMADVNEL